MNRKEQYRISELGVSFVEIAMVVVVVSMMIGAALTYKNLRHAAKLRSIITEVSHIKSAIGDFRDKHFALPGDMPLAYTYWGSVCGGNSSTTVGGCNGNGDTIIRWDNIEGVKAWQHLQLSGLLKGLYNGTCTWADCQGEPGVNIPASDFPNAGYYLDNGSHTGLRNAIGIAKAGKFGVAGNEILTPLDAETLDTKLDDGMANSGTVMAYPIAIPCAVPSGGGFAVPGSPHIYNLAQDEVACQLSFRIFSY